MAVDRSEHRREWRRLRVALERAETAADRLFSEEGQRAWVPFGIELETIADEWLRGPNGGLWLLGDPALANLRSLRRIKKRDRALLESDQALTVPRGEASLAELKRVAREESLDEEWEQWLSMPIEERNKRRAPQKVRAERKWWTATRGQFRTHPPGLLGDFCRLSYATDLQIRTFARRRGLLLLCKHWRPCNHNPHPFRAGPAAECSPMPFEPLAAWRALARSFKAILAVATQLNGSRRASAEEWEEVARYFLSDLRLRWELYPAQNIRTLAGQRLWLGWAVDQWLRLANVRLRFQWSARRARGEVDTDAIDMTMAGFGLFPRLARELAFAVARIPGVYWCSWRGHWFVPESKRKRTEGERHCCEDEECQRRANAKHQEEGRLRRKQSKSP